MNELDDYSQRFADVLFAAFPNWKEFLSVQSLNDSVEESSLLVKVPAPAKGLLTNDLIPDSKDFLTIDSCGEITIGFDYYHTHFDMFSDTNETEEFNQAVEFVHTIIEEKLCVVVVLNGHQWCGSTAVNAGERPDLSNFQNLNSSQDVYVRSWRGTYNQKYRVTELISENNSAR